MVLFYSVVIEMTSEMTTFRDLHAADARYHLDCWSGATETNMSAVWVQLLKTLLLDGMHTTVKKQVSWSGATVTAITASLMHIQQTVQT